MYEETSLQEHSLERGAEHLFAQIAPNIALENLGWGVTLLENRENAHALAHRELKNGSCTELFSDHL